MKARQSCVVAEWHTGKTEAPALLLLHGFGASHLWWMKMIDALAQGYQVYSLDLRFWQALPAMAEELLDWTRQKHLAHMRVLGHSLGALLAMHLAAQAPQLVERLILVNPPITLPERSLWQWLRTCHEARTISRHPPPKDKWHRSLHPQAVTTP